jgi:hypothetical protein
MMVAEPYRHWCFATFAEERKSRRGRRTDLHSEMCGIPARVSGESRSGVDCHDPTLPTLARSLVEDCSGVMRSLEPRCRSTAAHANRSSVRCMKEVSATNTHFA